MTDRCCKVMKHSKIKVEEGRRKAIFKNRDKLDFRVIKVDGCLINEGPRSDYIVSEIGSASVIIELKGVDVSRACEQLFATVTHPEAAEFLERQLGFLVVCSRYPRFDTFVRMAKDRAAKSFRAGFYVCVGHGEFEIGDLVAIAR